MWQLKEYEEMRNKSYAKPIIHPLVIGNEFLGHAMAVKKSKVSDVSFLKNYAETQDWKANIDIRKIAKPLTAAIVTDIYQNIQWVSSYFFQMTGYMPEEAIGKQPRFLQGAQTSTEDRHKIRTNLSSLKPFHGQLVNYRKDGEPYLCKVEILPVFNKSGKHVNFIAFETDKV